MSNRIIKDFKGWNLLNETADIAGIPSNSPINTPAPTNLPGIPGIKPPTPGGIPVDPNSPASRVLAAGTAAQNAAAAQAAAAAKTSTGTKAPAAPIVPTPDLTASTVIPTALTRNDWAAIQAKLNAAETVLTLPTVPKTDTNTQYSNQYQNNANVPLTSASTGGTTPTYDPATGKVAESRTRLYESLTEDGQAGPLTIAAVAAFVQKYNQVNPTSPLPTTPATATSIDPAILKALSTIQSNAAGIQPPNPTTPQNPTGTVDPAAVEAADTLSIEIAEMIVALFVSGNPIWEPANGLLGDNENVAKQIFNNYWITNIMPKINMLPANSQNKSRLAATQAAIDSSLGGFNLSDEVTFQIETKNGPMKYTVDTDF
jgi:hypothetical protein